MNRAVLVDTTLCTGCRGCQVACKQENHNLAESTEFFASAGGYQNPAKLSDKTYSLVTFNEVEGEGGDFKWVFTRKQCMHCVDPACASACLVGALQRRDDGAVAYDEGKCIGCRYCQLACPFGVPALEWEKQISFIRKCTFCTTRAGESAVPEVLNEGHSTPHEVDEERREIHVAARLTPACAMACPTSALLFGDREQLLNEARRRIAEHPERYVNHIYGEKEAGGTSWLYLAAVPFGEIGLPTHLGERSYPSYTAPAMSVVAPQILGVGVLAGGFYWLTRRRKKVAEAGQGGDDTTGAKSTAPQAASSEEAAAEEQAS